MSEDQDWHFRGDAVKIPVEKISTSFGTKTPRKLTSSTRFGRLMGAGLAAAVVLPSSDDLAAATASCLLLEVVARRWISRLAARASAFTVCWPAADAAPRLPE